MHTTGMTPEEIGEAEADAAMEAQDLGIQAAIEGKTIADCPYEEGHLRDIWVDGFEFERTCKSVDHEDAGENVVSFARAAVALK